MARELERIFKLHKGGVGLRVWAAAKDLRDRDEGAAQRSQVVAAIDALTPEQWREGAQVAAAEAVAGLPFVNAVEVSDGPIKDAVIIYPEWP